VWREASDRVLTALLTDSLLADLVDAWRHVCRCRYQAGLHDAKPAHRPHPGRGVTPASAYCDECHSVVAVTDVTTERPDTDPTARPTTVRWLYCGHRLEDTP
jgi:hypothetical protein